jgi:membrane associated rhomboid family serine protease
MDRLLARLERRFGKLAIHNLTTFIVGGMAVVYVLSMARPDFRWMLALDMSMVRRGEVWRLVTYLFLPTNSSLMWAVFALYWVWMIGSTLESEWGAFRFNVYYLLGMVGTTLAAVFAHGAVGNFYLNLTMIFAFATLMPDYEILLFFVLPVRMKWLAWLSLAYLAVDFVSSGWSVRAAIIASMLNYLVFFGGFLLGLLRSTRTAAAQASRRASSAPPAAVAAGRACAICGKNEGDGADIRVCPCEKCRATGGPRTLCLEHARNH